MPGRRGSRDWAVRYLPDEGLEWHKKTPLLNFSALDIGNGNNISLQGIHTPQAAAEFHDVAHFYIQDLHRSK
ncbi:MAG: hypothetical protein ABR985_17470 [Methanotrichaceae archaeon]